MIYLYNNSYDLSKPKMTYSNRRFYLRYLITVIKDKEKKSSRDKLESIEFLAFLLED